jgi:hypothetical protein
MTSEGTSPIKQRYFNEHLPNIKPIDKIPMKQPPLRNPSLFPPIPQSLPLGSAKPTNTLESPKSPIIFNPIGREAARPSLPRSNLPSLSPRSSFSQTTQHALPKRTTRYDHISSKINTGLLRFEGGNRTEADTYQLGPSRPLNWTLLKQELENDKQIRAQAKRIQFNTGVTYTTQLTKLSNLVRTKIKSYVASMMNSGEERYKIVVQLNVFPTVASGLHIASRCLWNTLTDNSITLRMQGIDCNLLIVAFLCYTDLGAL